MDGYEVIKHLKAIGIAGETPAIFLTALHNPEDIVKGFKMERAMYVSKPFCHRGAYYRVIALVSIRRSAQRTIMQQRDELQATVDAVDKITGNSPRPAVADRHVEDGFQHALDKPYADR